MLAVMAVLGCLTAAATAASKHDEAKGLVKKAVAFLKKNGNEKGFTEFNNGAGQFTKGELYIFVIDPKGATLAHGGNQKLIGKNMFELKDSDGKHFIQDIIKAGKEGGGWTEYKWTNPTSKKIEPKLTYVEPVGDLAVACGFYK